MKTILLIFFIISTQAQNTKPLCQLVDNHVYSPLLSERKNPYDNGYPEERYEEVLNQFIVEFTPDIKKRKGTFHIMRDWSDGAVNAWAWRIGDEYWLEVPGGMSRYHLITEEGFLTTLCHELGHLLGGYPQSNEISYEGQADYYSSMKCMERILTRLNIPAKKVSKQEDLDCYGDYCQERFIGIKSLTSYYASLERSPFPTRETPDQNQVNSTLTSHPKAQCRFDTMVESLKCSNRDDFSYENSKDGACLGVGSRAKCWFAN